MRRKVVLLCVITMMAVSACGTEPNQIENVDTIEEKVSDEVTVEETQMEQIDEISKEDEIEMEEITRVKAVKMIYSDNDAVCITDYVYDDNNRLVEMGDYKYEYDDAGYLILEKRFDSGMGDPNNEYLYQYIEYSYDTNGNKVRENAYLYNIFTEDYMPNGYTEYEYDNAGNILREKVYSYSVWDEMDVLYDHNVYTYDEQGRMISHIWYSKDEADSEEGHWKYIYEYNDDGKLCQISVTTTDSDEIKKVRKNEFDENGNIIIECEEFSDVTIEYTYDENGNKITSTKKGLSWWTDDEIYDYYQYKTFEYDNESNIIRETHQDICLDGQTHGFEENYTIEYEYETVKVPVSLE